MPQDNPFVITGKILYCLQLAVSYPLVIYVTNNIVEGFVFAKMRYSMLRIWLKNFSRLVVLFVGVCVAIYFYYLLHRIMALSGVVLGSFIVLITPNYIHYKVVAETQCSRCMDLLVIIYAIIISIGLGTAMILQWCGVI